MKCMLITKTVPVGIDIPIQKLQIKLHDGLLKKWGIDPLVAVQNEQYVAHGRCYRNKTENGYRADLYTGNGDYVPLGWDDAKSAVSFFGMGTNESKQPTGVKANVHLVFFVNLSKLKPSVAHRADEEVRLDVLGLLMPAVPFGFTLMGTETSVDMVLKEYPASYKGGTLAAVDMQPVHCFRLNFELTYEKQQNYCP